MPSSARKKKKPVSWADHYRLHVDIGPALPILPYGESGGTELSLQLLDSFFFNDTATTEIYTLSLHDALPISRNARRRRREHGRGPDRRHAFRIRSEEHTSELQSRQYLICRLLLEKKKS